MRVSQAGLLCEDRSVSMIGANFATFLLPGALVVVSSNFEPERRSVNPGRLLSLGRRSGPVLCRLKPRACVGSDCARSAVTSVRFGGYVRV